MADGGKWDVVVLGGGAAGLMAAVEAGKRGRNVLLLEHSERVGKKILISGGGRCNFTNLHTSPANFLSANPHFAKSALARFSPRDFIALVEKHSVAWHEKKLGQLFCDRSAQQIVDLLLAEAREASVEIKLNTAVERVRREGDGFAVETSGGLLFAKKLVVATGGLSIPKIGATGIGYDIAQGFGLAMEPTRAALVPLVFTPEQADQWCDLSGISVEAVATAPGSPWQPKRGAAVAFPEKILITHRGLSGPGVLQISSYWKQGQPLVFDLAPGEKVFAPLLETDAVRTPEALAACARATAMPQRWSTRWMKIYAPERLRNPDLTALEETLHRWTVHPAGTEGYAKAEVTAGGVSTAELDSTTLEAKKAPGLHFVGEVVDVTGHLGGFNFQWAWASGAAAGRAV